MEIRRSSRYGSYSPEEFRLKQPSPGIKHHRLADPQRIYDLYEFQEELGHGAFGVVTKVIEKSTKKSWAIKIVQKTYAGLKLMDQVEREIEILKVVNHQHIIYMDKLYETPKKIYMVLELCSSELYKVYHDNKPFTERTSKKVILQLADAVSYLHKNDIVHRDIKMENILLAENPTDSSDDFYIKLTDFGLSIKKSGSGLKSLMTEFCGTIIYMPPEILQQRNYSELCDVWALGVILYMMLYGKNPYIGKSDDIIKEKIINDQPDYVGEVRVCEEGISLLKQCLSKDPAHRITAHQLYDNNWLRNRKTKTGSTGKDQNILNLMKQFRYETTDNYAPRRTRSMGWSIVNDGLFSESATKHDEKKPTPSDSKQPIKLK